MAASQLRVGDETYEIFRLDALQDRWDVARLPYPLRVLLENLLRAGEDVEPVAAWGGRRGARARRGRPATSRAVRSPSGRAGSSTRTSPASPRSSTSPRCGTQWK